MGGRGDIRPMPADFPQFAWSMGGKALQAKFSAGQDVIARWRREIGWVDPRIHLASPPADFAEQAAKSTMAMLMRRYGVGERQIKTWAKATGTPPAPRSYVRRPVPDDFAEVAPTMVKYRLAEHYVADVKTVTRWISESGIRSAAPVPQYHPRRGGMVFQGHARFPLHREERTRSIYDDAADTLRRERFVVFRSNDRGLADQKGAFWRVGNVVCAPDDLLTRAAKYQRKAA